MNNAAYHDATDTESSAPLDGATRGKLEFVRGAAFVTITSAAMPDLYRARFAGPAPNVQANNGHVLVQYRRLSLTEWAKTALLWGRYAATITLNAAIPWQIVVRGGIANVSADLRGLQLVGLEVSGGASEVIIELPQPIATVPIRIAGGASQITLRRPPGAAVLARVGSGAGHVSFDDQYFNAIGGPLRLATPDHDNAADRYAVEIVGGASRLTIDAR
jgi:hypothetical protein